MNIRARLERLEHPVLNPFFGLADRLRKAKSTPAEQRDRTKTIAELEASGDRLSLRLARALRRTEGAL